MKYIILYVLSSVVFLCTSCTVPDANSASNSNKSFKNVEPVERDGLAESNERIEKDKPIEKAGLAKSDEQIEKDDRIESGEPVKNMIVKKVKSSRMGGTWRYFFQIENPSNCRGIVKVDIEYNCPALKNMGFRSPSVRLGNGLYTVFYVDHPVAPYHLGDHAEYGIQEFHIKVIQDQNTIYSCTVPVTSKYEDATGYY